MKKTKLYKIIAILLVATMLCLVFASCKEEPADDKNEQGASAPAESEVIMDNSDTSADDESSVEASGETTDNETSNEVSTDTSDDTSDESSEPETNNSEPESSEPVEHTHSFVVSNTKEATCTKGGSIIYECECGEEKKESTPALGHDDGEWVTIVPATTEHNGTKYLYCTRCDEKIDEASIPRIEEDVSDDNSSGGGGTHIHGTQVVVVDPTCTEEGYSYIECKPCGVYSKFDVVAALGHKKSSPWVTVKEATASAPGLKEQRCERCGELMASEEIPQLDKYSVIATAENTYLVEERILYYINQYRTSEGACEMALTNEYDANGNPTNKSGKFARGRALQLVTNYAHDTDDIRSLATELQFGDYVPEHPESYFDFETEEVIYTGNMIPAYYQPPGSEAIGNFVNLSNTVDNLAWSIARKFHESSAHWDYIGADRNPYIAVGVKLIENKCFVCLFAMATNSYD